MADKSLFDTVLGGNPIEESPRELELPMDISYFKLNGDGTYTEASPVTASVYVSDKQLKCLWDAKIAAHIRTKYGPYVGVMHSYKGSVRAPRGPSMMFVLGSCAE